MKRCFKGGDCSTAASYCALIVFAVAAGCMSTEVQTSYKPYVLEEGMWCGRFETGYVETRAAAIAALTTLQMPVVAEGRMHHGSYLDTQTPDGLHVRIHFRSLARHHAGSGEATRVSLRVGGFGTHEKVCAMLLDEIGRHLGSATTLLPPPPTAGSPAQASPSTVVPPAPTSQGPALPPQPVPVQK
jgi:hypothetical protein